MKPSPAWKSDYAFAPLQEPQTRAEEAAFPTEASTASSPNIATLVERLSEVETSAPPAPRPAEAAPAAPPSRPQAAPPALTVAPPRARPEAPQQPRLPAPAKKTRLPIGSLAAAAAGIALVPMSFAFFLWWQDTDQGPAEELAVTVPDSLLAALPTDAADAPLSAPERIDATAGRTVAFPIAVKAADQLPARSVIAVTGLPQGATLSQGRAYGDDGWSLRPDEIAGLQLQAPDAASMTDMTLELVAGDGAVLAQSTTQLSVTPPQVATVDGIDTPRLPEVSPAPQVAAIAQPEPVVEPEAAAESAPATTADMAAADETAPADDGETVPSEQVASTETTGAIAPAAPEQEQASVAEPEPDVKVNTVKTVAIAPPRETKPYDGAMALGSPAEEWMETKTAVDMHARAEQKSETVKVADGGLKVQVKARDNNWIQVHDPESGTTGWIYNRFLKEAEAPAQ